MTPKEWIKGALPCPFCGASPDFGPKDSEREGTAWATVFCRDEDCPANQGANVTNMDDDENFHPVEEAVKLWNRRSAPEGAAHLAAALEEIARRDAEIARLRAEAGRVVVPELTPDGMSTAAFVEGYRFAASRAHSVPSSRVLKDGEVGVDAETMLEVVNSVKFMASFECQCDLSVGHICEGCCASRLGRKLDSLRTQATATESGEKGGAA